MVEFVWGFWVEIVYLCFFVGVGVVFVCVVWGVVGIDCFEFVLCFVFVVVFVVLVWFVVLVCGWFWFWFWFCFWFWFFFDIECVEEVVEVCVVVGVGKWDVVVVEFEWVVVVFEIVWFVVGVGVVRGGVVGVVFVGVVFCV